MSGSHSPLTHLRWRWLAALALLPLAMAFAGCAGGAAGTPAGERAEESAGAAATLVGGGVCAECHSAEAALWRGSHHDLSMQEATPVALLGDFAELPAAAGSIPRGSTRAAFVRRGAASFVRTADAEGRERELPVAYAFGVEPLQQLLVPAHGGRLQAFSVAWDSRPKGSGGQRWFALDSGAPSHPGEAGPWSARDANWNGMCAECHSTGLRKRYDAVGDRFDTRWAEVDVSCEACHGPGSRHVAWARAASPGDGAAASAPGGERAAPPPNHGFAASLLDPNRGAWTIDPATGSARRTAPLPARSEIDSCARCHSRRTALVESDEVGGPLLDSHRPALLEEGLYQADGQIDGEVFEYGSFLQSRMHAKGVSCSDCHDPHSGSLRYPGDGGNAMCGTCHAPARFDRPEHHHHPGSAASGTSGQRSRGALAAVRCVDCHMPTRRYMGVDDRRDHSLRAPRPDLTLKIGTPNACNGCHRERSAAWAQAAVVRWYGPERSSRPHYGEAITAGRRGDAAAGPRLLAVAADREVPAIARATALALLARVPAGADLDEEGGSPSAGVAENVGQGGSSASGGTPGGLAARVQAVLAVAARDAEPLLRLGAAQGAMGVAPAARLAAIGGLLHDPLRAVREEAARALLAVPPASLSPGARTAFDSALAELRASLSLARERPEVLLELGGIALVRGELAAAEAEYQAALRLDPAFVPAYANLAEAYRLAGREDEVERVLLAGLARATLAPPARETAPLHHALGLALIRQGRLAEAIEPLRRAALLAPGEPRFAQVLSLARRELASGSASQPPERRPAR